MSETSIKQNSLCLICGLRGTHDIYLTSGQSTVSATGTQLGKFLYKIISEEPCYSISEVICQQCYLLLDRLDTYQARAAEINLHISDRYKDTKLGLIGCKKRISDLIVNSLSNIKSFKNGTTLNVSDELSVTIFHEALPRSVNKGIFKSVVLSSQQKEFRQTSHLKQFNSDFLRCRTKKRLFIHNLIRSKQIYKKDFQMYKVANKPGFLKKKLVTDVKNNNRPRPSLKRKFPICFKENSAPKKSNNNLITNISKSIRTNLAKCNVPDDLSSLPLNNFHKTDKINLKKNNVKYIDKNCENYKNSTAESKSSDPTVTSCLSESLNSNNFDSQIDILKDVGKSNNLQQVSGQKSDNESSKKLLLNRSNSDNEEESFLITAAEENIDCEDGDENTQNSTSSGSNCSSSSSSSNDSSSSYSSDSSSDDSSSSTEDNSSDDEEQKYGAKTDINSDSNICDENIKNMATNLESNIKDNYMGSQSERDSNIIKKETPNNVEKDDLAGSDICDQKISKNVRTATKNHSFSSSAKQIKAQESKNSNNISEVVDSLDPQFAQAAWMQNSLASSLLQSFLSTSLWMNSAGSPNKNSMNSQNQNKLDDCQNSNSDDMASEVLPNTVGFVNDKQKRIELKNTGQSYINTKGKLVEAKRVSPQDCSRCPLRCNGRLNDEKRQAIFADYWGLADYNLQREYLASHMDREERMGPSGITRNVILYYLTYNDAKVQVCRQFFLKTLDISEKASRLVIEKRLKS